MNGPGDTNHFADNRGQTPLRLLFVKTSIGEPPAKAMQSRCIRVAVPASGVRTKIQRLWKQQNARKLSRPTHQEQILRRNRPTWNTKRGT